MTERNLNACLCGCGDSCKGTYRPGHDARHAGTVGRAMAGLDRTAPGYAEQRLGLLRTLTSSALQAKASRVESRAVEKASVKPRTRKTPALPGEVRVGRWWYRVTGRDRDQLTYTTKAGQTKTAPAGAETR